MRLPAVPADNKFRILVVEDDAMIAKLISIHLEKAKFQSIVARDGLEGWSQFAQIDPHLVLSDINMPGLSGHELVEKIRSTSSVPILMMTAADSEEYQMKGFKVGADDYIPKPFNPKLLIARCGRQSAPRLPLRRRTNRKSNQSRSSQRRGLAQMRNLRIHRPDQPLSVRHAVGPNGRAVPQLQRPQHLVQSGVKQSSGVPNLE